MADSFISESMPSRPGVALPEWACDPSLAAQALAADRRAVTEVDLGLVWRELVQGLAVVLGGFFDENRCGLVLSAVGSRSPVSGPIDGRLLRVVEAVLNGAVQKAVAIEFGLAPSTVALSTRLALERLGVSGKPSHVHPLLMLAATPARRHVLVPSSASYFTRGDQELRVIAMPRPDRALLGQVPAAEFEVVSALVDGRSYAEIAALRGTSSRTVANQLAAVFRRLQVSGRSELMQRLFVLSGWLASAPPSASLSAPPPPMLRPPRARESLITGVHPVTRLDDDAAPPRALGTSR